MRSIVPRIYLFLFGTVVFALIGCLVTAGIAARRLAGDNDFIAATQQLQADAACHIFERDGFAALQEYLKRVDSLFRARHHLVKENGRDAATGDDLTNLLNRAQNRDLSRDLFARDLVLQRPSSDHRYRLLIELSPPPFGPWEILPYFLWVFAVIAAIGYGIAVYFIRPLTALQATVESFGKGQLDARVDLKRKDEFGDLGIAFNRMAQRIEGLVTAERLLLQDISHELRSPLTRLGFAVDLARNATDSEAAFRRVNKELSRLTELIDQLLQLTRAEGDVTARETVEISLADIVVEVVEDFRLEAESKGCYFTTRLDDSAIVRGDGELIRRAFDNVVSNALRHAPPDSEVAIIAQSNGGSVSVTVRDLGPGVPDDMLTEIFKPFRRVEMDRDRNTGGLGLGLSIARRAIELHQGSITALNSSPGLAILINFPLC